MQCSFPVLPVFSIQIANINFAWWFGRHHDKYGIPQVCRPSILACHWRWDWRYAISTPLFHPPGTYPREQMRHWWVSEDCVSDYALADAQKEVKSLFQSRNTYILQYFDGYHLMPIVNDRDLQSCLRYFLANSSNPDVCRIFLEEKLPKMEESFKAQIEVTLPQASSTTRGKRSQHHLYIGVRLEISADYRTGSALHQEKWWNTLTRHENRLWKEKIKRQRNQNQKLTSKAPRKSKIEQQSCDWLFSRYLLDPRSKIVT